MKKEIEKIFKNKLFRVLALFLLWIFLTFWYVITFDTSFSVWSYNHKNSNIKNLNFNLFYKGEVFRGEFKAQDNNLGIVSIRFQTYTRPPYKYEDKYLFRLKEKNAKKWYYSNIYRSGFIYDIPFLPFGFPQIKDSKGKTYEFEIKTLNTNKVNKISISKRYPILQSKYKYSGKELIKNPKEMFHFLIIKLTNAFGTPDIIFSSFIYLLPLLFYLAWILVLEKIKNPLVKKIVTVIAVLERSPLGPLVRLFKKIFIFNLDYFLIFIAITDVLITQLSNDIIYIVLLVLWIKTLFAYKKDSKQSFVVGLTLIVTCPLFLIIKLEPTAEKAAAWAFMFLVAGTIQILIEQGKYNKKKK